MHGNFFVCWKHYQLNEKLYHMTMFDCDFKTIIKVDQIPNQEEIVFYNQNYKNIKRNSD